MAEPSADVRALVPLALLDELTFVELHAVRRLDVAAPDDVEITPQYTLDAGTSDDATRFRIVLSVALDLGVGDVRVAVAAYYTAQDGAPTLSQALVVEYANEVGVMTMLPFLRQGIADVTQRVFGTPLLMPVMPRGSLAFPVPV
ncbi:hypothetical protein [Cellulomonas sp. PSBB021]|uniref:hypothetical protein n=1 Tax=Cellulomonas sp. PSBB021 TaxID=2003551 RepID=UPI000B8D54EF|nr:hypothetical protein [Cellulomonas sp. PSBB021]ASR55528.1 hypothetical protein CBP52_11000 [Cellulomonas sp. PSBB021]